MTNRRLECPRAIRHWAVIHVLHHKEMVQSRIVLNDGAAPGERPVAGQLRRVSAGGVERAAMSRQQVQLLARWARPCSVTVAAPAAAGTCERAVEVRCARGATLGH